MTGRDSIVGTATCYGLDGPDIESRLGGDFLHLSRQTLGPNRPLVQWYRVWNAVTPVVCAGSEGYNPSIHTLGTSVS